MPARLTTLSGTVDGINAFYSIGIYEGEENYYQVLSWTLSSKKHTYQNKMKKVLYSFKEI